MADRTNIDADDVWVEPAYRNVQSEEGAYEAHAGWNVFIRVAEDNGWIYHGYNDDLFGDGGLTVFSSRADAEWFAVRIGEHGSVNLDGWWEEVGSANTVDYPDYVLNPHRPEYN